MAHGFEIVREIRRQYRRFNTTGTQLTVRLNPPTAPDANPVDHFLASVNDLFEHVLQDVGDTDMVGIAIHNESNPKDKPMGLSIRRRHQLLVDAIWSVFDVTQSNSRFNSLHTLIVVLHSVRMPVGFGLRGDGIKTMGRPLSIMAHLKKCIVQVRTETNCLAHALIITIAKPTNNSNYKAYRQGRKIYPKVDQLLAATGIILDNGGESPNSNVFSTIFGNIKSLRIPG